MPLLSSAGVALLLVVVAFVVFVGVGAGAGAGVPSSCSPQIHVVGLLGGFPWKVPWDTAECPGNAARSHVRCRGIPRLPITSQVRSREIPPRMLGSRGMPRDNVGPHRFPFCRVRTTRLLRVASNGIPSGHPAVSRGLARGVPAGIFPWIPMRCRGMFARRCRGIPRLPTTSQGRSRDLPRDPT